VAASLLAIDLQRRHAWGRYWGALAAVPCLHFDACYYQPLAWCMDQGFACFEGGAQGEHKMARGLLPAPTLSSHWLAHAEFRHAIADFLGREGEAMNEYAQDLALRQPFKAAP
jgi:predicted N-acyltransferase